MLRSLLLAGVSLTFCCTASAAPLLRADIAVIAEIVTLGDMFADAGDAAATPIFRAPAPGTAGLVPVATVSAAVRAAGVSAFDTAGLAEIRVARSGTRVDQALVATLIEAELDRRGERLPGVTASIAFDAALDAMAAATAEPVRLRDFSYRADSGRFSGSLILAGVAEPLAISGRVDLLVSAPHLVAPATAGTILSATDIEMRPVPLRQADAAGAIDPSQLIGKQLRRSARAGLLLRPADVVEPVVVTRNAEVTVYLNQGPLTLSMRGKALNAAAAGEPVQILNMTSRKILFGVARADGSVAITPAGTAQIHPHSAPAQIAGL
ncbi:flagella basal body P-ring formation protein FlgA [Devosia enhydra]|uniref:Flagella basal body P-ring formation protein FlgA n=1 Tax=Devosia enhydra TaxID=665118 RepID=A0A1K2HTJ9_9HYPH|nr:flagellar basal body P-ring formation chaperone FlgA [Devosia enhydra]SFZ81511.1 flagella basal body P-ring formation protein FlgA [Devosia enhydra]